MNKRVDDAMELFQVSFSLLAAKVNGGLAPLADFPHDDRHTAPLDGFIVGAVALLSRGFDVLFVNHRGSI